jgi:hypothetical protein
MRSDLGCNKWRGDGHVGVLREATASAKGLRQEQLDPGGDEESMLGLSSLFTDY